MTPDDIIEMAKKSCDSDKVDAWHNGFWTLTQEELERFAALVAAAEREKVAAWMMGRGYATGNGDSTEDLLHELEWQIAENWNRALSNGITTEREACARVCDVLSVHPKYASDITKLAAQAIRARSEL